MKKNILIINTIAVICYVVLVSFGAWVICGFIDADMKLTDTLQTNKRMREQSQAQPADTAKAEPVQVDTFPKMTEKDKRRVFHKEYEKRRKKHTDHYSACYQRCDGKWAFKILGNQCTGFDTEKECLEIYEVALREIQKQQESYLQTQTKKATVSKPDTVYMKYRRELGDTIIADEYLSGKRKFPNQAKPESIPAFIDTSTIMAKPESSK